MDKFIRQDSEEIKELNEQLEQAKLCTQEALSHQRPTIKNERYLTAEEVMNYLHIAPRTLQNLRDRRLICFTTIGGKILYPENELLELLKDNSTDVELPF
ncbi:MAG: helix-turn-helix domain-containing protein [Bacteroidales bacterium]